MGTRTFESLQRGRREVMVWCAAKGPSFQVCTECPEPPHHLVNLQLFKHHLTLLVSIINEEEGRHPILCHRAENSHWKLRKKNLTPTHCLLSHFSLLITEVVDFKHWISKDTKISTQIYKSLFSHHCKFSFLRISFFFSWRQHKGSYRDFG